MLQQLADILLLPESCLIHSKLTKAFFKRNFDLSVAERKLLDDASSVVQMDLLASVKTGNSNIEGYADEQMQFVEVLLIAAQTNESDFDKNKLKIAELIQKYIPYPILLCIYCDKWFIMNTCDKRINRNETDKRTIEKSYYTENISRTAPNEKQKAFLDSLTFSGMNKQNLKTLFDDYTNRIIALQAAELMGTYVVRKNERSKEDVQYLENIARLQSEILTLQNQAKKETQLAVQVKLNAEIQERRKEIQKLEKILTS
jgi:hypothetical protein